MTLEEYQKQALVTATYPKEHNILYPALGLNGEAGEVAEKVKKVLRDNNGDFSIEKCHAIAKELGDCMWYISAMAHDIGYTLEEIGEMNINKLRSRQQRNMIHGDGDDR